MTAANQTGHTGARRPGAAFLLTQLGAHAAQRFAERIQPLGVTPPDVGLLRMIAGEPGRSQRSLAADLGVVPSRVVTLVDSLDGKGLVERRKSATDRRNYALHLTEAGQEILRRIRQIATANDDELCEALDTDERAQLARLLHRMADQQGLGPGIHPGYRHQSSQ